MFFFSHWGIPFCPQYPHSLTPLPHTQPTSPHPPHFPLQRLCSCLSANYLLFSLLYFSVLFSCCTLAKSTRFTTIITCLSLITQVPFFYLSLSPGAWRSDQRTICNTHLDRERGRPEMKKFVWPWDQTFDVFYSVILIDLILLTTRIYLRFIIRKLLFPRLLSFYTKFYSSLLSHDLYRTSGDMQGLPGPYNDF